MPSLSTKLSAVNIMLSVIGEAKVSSLVSGDIDAEQAEDVLDEISMEFQVKGWKFNEEIRTLLADDAGLVWVPSNCLEIDPTDRTNNHLVQRGDRLYDTASATYNVGKSVEVNLKLLLDFEDLPQPARRYVEVRAARTYQKRVLGSPEIDAFTRDDENRAWLAFLDFSSSTNDRNIFNNREMQDSINRRIGGGSSWLS